MSDFSSLEIQPSEVLTVEHWNAFMDRYADLVNQRNIGLIANGVSVGRDTYADENGANYPWEYETIGVSKNNLNLRIQSPNSIFLHSDSSDESDEKRQPTLAIKENRSVGIGTISPDNKLHVYSSINRGGKPPLKIQTNFGHVDIGVRDEGWAYFETDSPKYYFNKELRVGGGKIGSHGNSDLSLTTDGGSVKMTIKKGGNVGIGTNSPNAKLEINGGPKWTSNGWNKSVKLQNGSAIEFDVRSDLKFGIGASHNSPRLYFFSTRTEGDSAAAEYRLMIDEDGSVRIPGKLIVSGGIRLEGDGKIETSSGVHIEIIGQKIWLKSNEGTDVNNGPLYLTGNDRFIMANKGGKNKYWP